MENEEMMNRLNALEKKVYSLVLKVKGGQKHLESVLEENIYLKKTINQQKQKLNNFQNQENFNKIVKSILEEKEGTAGLKKKIDEYIDNIDRCIEFLKVN